MKTLDRKEMEIMIADARMQKDLIEMLVRDFEQKTRLEDSDMRYLDSVLHNVESGLKRIRRSYSKTPIRYL